MLEFKIKFDDKEMFKEIRKQSAKLEVGFFEEDIYEEVDKPFYAPKGLRAKSNLNKPRRYAAHKAIPVAQVAASNEYGVPEHNQPPRPFMRDTIQKNRMQWRKLVQDNLPILMDVEKMAEQLGMKMVKDVRKTILNFMIPLNAPSTVKRKGFNKPLIDSEQMLESVKWKVNGR